MKNTDYFKQPEAQAVTAQSKPLNIPVSDRQRSYADVAKSPTFTQNSLADSSPRLSGVYFGAPRHGISKVGQTVTVSNENLDLDGVFAMDPSLDLKADTRSNLKKANSEF